MVSLDKICFRVTKIEVEVEDDVKDVMDYIFGSFLRLLLLFWENIIKNITNLTEKMIKI